jgi:geranylgeranyl diphosphate synthase type I
MINAAGKNSTSTIEDVDSFNLFMEQASKTVEEHILSYLPPKVTSETIERLVGTTKWSHDTDAYSSVIAEPVWDLISRKGKCWRPILGILLLRIFGKPEKEYEQLICVVTELIHTGALIIDDIEDSSALRRGGPTIHIKYKLDVALNAGNTLYFLPIPLIVNHPLLSESQKYEFFPRSGN